MAANVPRSPLPELSLHRLRKDFLPQWIAEQLTLEGSEHSPGQLNAVLAGEHAQGLSVHWCNKILGLRPGLLRNRR